MPDRAAPIRVAVVGASLNPTCGVRDHALVLAGELDGEEIECAVHWLTRGERSLRGSRREMAAWRAQLARDLHERRPDAILLHYSVFTLSHKGVPLFLHRLLRSLRELRVPIVTVMHEYAYPWRLGGWRGKVWALTQRAALVELLRASTSLLVTAESRRPWLESCPWIPHRPVAVAPVFSNLPPPGARSDSSRERALVGLFGYSYEGAAVALILDAVAELGRRGRTVQLMLLGAPGPSSAAGEEWQREARARGLDGVLSFSGRLELQALSDALAACDVLLFGDSAGPTSRKGTLAGALRAGRPVVAIDGPLTWRRLADARAVVLAQPSPRGLAGALELVLGDSAGLDALGARARAFYEAEMDVSHTVSATKGLLLAALGSA